MNYDRLLQLGGIDREVPPIPGYITKEQLQGEIEGIGVLIPEEATEENQLADKQYVNTKVATDSASFRGTYNLVSDLSLTTAATHEQVAAALATKMTSLSITPDNNDFSYVLVPENDAVPSRIARTDRYKFNGTSWAYEFTLGDADLAPYRKFKDTWHTDTTLLQFCQDVVSDTSVIVGDLFLGSLTCSGLPTGMANGEVSIQVLPGLNGKMLLLTITSTNLSPYHWELSYYNGTLYGWRSFDLEGTARTLLAASINTMVMNENNGDITIQYDDGTPSNDN